MRIPPGPSRHTFSVWFILSVLIALTVSCAFAQAPVISAAPLTKLVVAGQPVSFAVGASGADLIYQWKHNGKVMSGATSSVLTIPSASLADSGYYQAVITNTGGSVSSVFYVNVAPVRSTLVQWRSTGPLSLSGFDDLAAFGTSYFLMGLKTDGTVVGGAIYPTERPAGLTSVVAIALGGTTAAALRADGTVVTWDAYNANFSKTTPFGLTNVVAIAAGNSHVVALRTDGTVVVWGTSQYGQTALPADVGRCVGIAASGHQSLALREDGTVVAWGSTDFGETAATVPAGLNNVIAVSSSNGSAALKADGTALAWGAFGTNGSTVVPAGLTNVVAVPLEGPTTSL